MKRERELKADFQKIIERNAEYESMLDDIDSILKTASDSDAAKNIVKKNWVPQAKETKEELEKLIADFETRYGKENFSLLWDESLLSRLPRGEEAEEEQAERLGRHSQIELDFGIVKPPEVSDKVKENIFKKILEEQQEQKEKQ